VCKKLLSRGRRTFLLSMATQRRNLVEVGFGLAIRTLGKKFLFDNNLLLLQRWIPRVDPSPGPLCNPLMQVVNGL
jgi:hypothetical protein